VCPAAAIAINRADKSITFEPFRCIICEACVEVCPRKSIDVLCQYRSPAYPKETVVYSTPPVEPKNEVGEPRVARPHPTLPQRERELGSEWARPAEGIPFSNGNAEIPSLFGRRLG
jgi:formate hydrogenlyase subunit 6/NADH:ubiquinone oxidoreductase subunit I